MNKTTLTALRGSIKKWKDIADGVGEDKGPDNCPLCKKFRLYTWCSACPVFAESGIGGCQGTPYIEWNKIVRYAAPRKATTPEATDAAINEYVYLLSLLPEGLYK